MYLNQTLLMFFMFSFVVILIFTSVTIRNLYISKKREESSLEIINNIRLKFDIYGIKQTAIESIAKELGAERAYIGEASSGSKKIDIVNAEYTISENIPSLKGDLTLIESNRLTQWAITNQEYFIPDAQAYIKKNRLEESLLGNFYKQNKIKSSYAIPLRFSGQILGVMVLHFTKNRKKLGQDDIAFLRTVTNNLAIAIYQSLLFTNLEKIARRETLLREITETIRSTLDIDKVLSIICKEIAKNYNVQRVAIKKLPTQDNNDNVTLLAEYKASKDIKGVSYMKNIKKMSDIINDWLSKKNGIIALDNIAKSNLDNYAKNEYKKLGVKSALIAPIKKNHKNWGYIFLTEYNYHRHWGDEDIKLLKAICNQIYLAINQVQLYKNLKNTAQKESLLREVASQIKLSSNLEEVYNYLIKKTAQEFNYSRVMFFETPTFEYKKPSLKTEFVLNKNSDLIKDSDTPIPDFFIDILEKTSEKLQPFTIDDTNTLHNINENDRLFLKKYAIKSLFIIPMIRYNGDIRILGIFVICNSVPKKWEKHETNIVNSIIESSVSIIWEITKIIEINHIRDTIIETLAHDLQVPLIGEEKALEYLVKMPKEATFEEAEDLIKELAQNNKDLTLLLKRLLSCYYYEAKRKPLHIKEFSLSKLIKEVEKSFDNSAKEKTISMSIHIQKGLPKIKADRNEIEKVLNCFIDNAIKYTPFEGKISIRAYSTKNNIIVYVRDTGEGIDPEKEAIIFERYQMAKTFQRKIGSGLNLYLSKKIIEAHNGKIWHKTKRNKGSIFCFSLPKN